MWCTFLIDALFLTNVKTNASNQSQKHQSLKMIAVEWNETSVCARVPLKVILCESNDSLTFTAPAESIKKSNQGMLARVQNQIMSEERSLGFVGNLLNRCRMLSIISLIGEHISVCSICSTLQEHLGPPLVANHLWEMDTINLKKKPLWQHNFHAKEQTTFTVRTWYPYYCTFICKFHKERRFTCTD